MARKGSRSSRIEFDPADLFVDIVRDDEWALFQASFADDGFQQNGWDMWGPGWVDHVPNTINAACHYLFGVIMLQYQLGAYYCPIPDVMIHGGRGCGKTDILAIANALWVSFNPGHDWLHTAITKDQAKKSYDAITRHGAWNADGRDFMGLLVVHTREAPFPDIEIRRLDEHDRGTRCWFRSMGKVNEPVELLRSFEAGRVSADEAYRTVQTEGAIRVLAGCLRGPNHYKMAREPELAQKYQDLAFEFSMTTDPDRRDEIEELMGSFGEEHGFAKRTKLMVYGNVGPHHWEWARFDRGKKHPDERYSVTWVSRDNPYFTKVQRRQLELQFADDPAQLQVEMNATRPVPSGEVFTASQIQSLFDPALDEAALRAVDPIAPRPGWLYKMTEKHGLIHYMKPPEPGASYVGGGDAGVQRIGVRGQWNVFVARIDLYKPENPVPFEVVYYRAGNETHKGQGSIFPWLHELQFIVANYNIPAGHFAAEATGDQKNVHEVAWDGSAYDNERLVIRPLSFASQKRKFLMYSQMILSNGLLVGPTIQMLESEMGGYMYSDLGLVQDNVMGLVSMCAVLWPIVSLQLDPAMKRRWLEQVEQDKVPDWWNMQGMIQDGEGREFRDESRDYRDGRF